MIRINLLAPERRRRAVSPLRLAGLPWKPILGGLAALLVLYPAVLFGFNQLDRHRLRRLQSRWESVRGEAAAWGQIHEALEGKRTERGLSEALTAPNAFWAPRLNLFSDSLVSGLWLRRLKLSPEDGVLEVSGSALPEAADRAPALDRYLERIKAHPDFSRFFSRVELGTMAQRRIGDFEVVDFSMKLHPAETK
ncbi:MAG: hypothetical protein COV76_03375 [Candidatus Omnitrophica bacterium CG11_big_fil_rev_8_21_14_0_20_64_10]|nr:MAG: hypothetical protein COV76_03375 [Candidatus Omnitrophica bacterium CG11_big_fil_rev_8_21_14_0_20_64_10]